MDGPEVSLNGSPTVSPTTAALWGSDPLPPKCPSSMYFFALSHAPPALAIMIASRTPEDRAPASIPPRASTSQQDTDQQRCDDCHQTRNDHFLQSSSCGNVYAVSIVRLGSTFHDSLVGTELSSYFFDHLVCSTSYGVHSERGEHERQHSSDEQTNDYDRLKQV